MSSLPTYFRTERFKRDYADLSPEQQARFREAVRRFVEDLDNGRQPRSSLGIRQIRSAPGVYEFHFEGDGRATFSFGEPVKDREPHIEWRRVGTHAVYNAP